MRFPGNLNNDKIEKLFCIVRSMVGGNRHLDVASCFYANRTLLINFLTTCSKNDDGSLNKEKHDNIFVQVEHEMKDAKDKKI